jgi:septum formation protein
MLYLASKSPRRRELLAQIRVVFECLDVDVPEVLAPGEAPEAFVRRLARDKAGAGLARVGDAGARVLGADTIVLIDDRVLGKPRDRDEGLAMLARLSGRKHRVLSAVALAAGGDIRTELSDSEVEFREIGAAERERYWDSGEPADKAGGYAIQGAGALFVKHLSGSYSGVMGLPLYETGRLLARLGQKE